MDDDFQRYLSEPCDEVGCDSVATHNCWPKPTCTVTKHGQFCNQHMDWERDAFARND